MLVLTRKTDQSILLGNDIEVLVVEIRGDSVKLGIKAPRALTILRSEIVKEIGEENRAAATAAPIRFKELQKILKAGKPPVEEGGAPAAEAAAIGAPTGTTGATGEGGQTP